MNGKKVLMPTELTAENGAKGAFSGEFFVKINVECQMCEGDGCDDCEFTGNVTEEEIIPWTTIKEMYRKIVNECGVRFGKNDSLLIVDCEKANGKISLMNDCIEKEV